MAVIALHDYAIKRKMTIKRVLEIASPHFDDVLTKYCRAQEKDIDSWVRLAEEMTQDPLERIKFLLEGIQEAEYINTNAISLACNDLDYAYGKLKQVQGQRNLLKIAVGGLHSAGKSTFINSLLDQIEQKDSKTIIGKLAPSGAAPTTRTITSFIFSEHPYFKDDKSKKYTLEEYQNKAIDQCFVGRFEVGVKNPLLKGIELMDIPGLFADDKDNATVQGVLDEIDILFWLVHIDDGTIKGNALKGLKEFKKPIVVVITQLQSKGKEGFEKVYASIRSEAEKNKLYVSNWNWFAADSLEILKPSVREIVRGKKEELKKLIREKAAEGGGSKQQASVFWESFVKSRNKFSTEVEKLKKRLNKSCSDADIDKVKEEIFKDIENDLKAYFRNLLLNVFDYKDVISDKMVEEHFFCRDDYRMSVTRESWDWEKLLKQVKDLDKSVREIVQPYTTQDWSRSKYDASGLKFDPSLWDLQSVSVSYSWGFTLGGPYGESEERMKRKIEKHIEDHVDSLASYMVQPVTKFLDKKFLRNNKLDGKEAELKNVNSIQDKLKKMEEILRSLEEKNG